MCGFKNAMRLRLRRGQKLHRGYAHAYPSDGQHEKSTQADQNDIQSTKVRLGGDWRVEEEMGRHASRLSKKILDEVPRCWGFLALVLV